jgi:glutathione peroxidase
MRSHLWVSISLASLLLACSRPSSTDPAGGPATSTPANAATPAKNPAEAASPQASGSLHDLSVTRLDGSEEKLSLYKGKVLLVVNTASECGYTPQYEGLQALHQQYESKGFAVLGFPSNDFGGQEPGNSSQIAAFCQKNYGVTFPMFAKVVTKGDNVSPVYKLLGTAGAPRWNFHKYVVGKDGKVRKSFPSGVEPKSAELKAAIDAALAETT